MPTARTCPPTPGPMLRCWLRPAFRTLLPAATMTVRRYCCRDISTRTHRSLLQGPDGGKGLMWYSRHYMQMQFLFGLPPLTQTGEEVLPLFLQMYQRPGYLASAAIVFGTQVENTDLFPQQAALAVEWHRLHAYPPIQYPGFHDPP